MTHPLHDDRANPESRAVLADWCEERGEPHGFVALARVAQRNTDEADDEADADAFS